MFLIREAFYRIISYAAFTVKWKLNKSNPQELCGLVSVCLGDICEDWQY